MKYLIALLTLWLSLALPSKSFAEWEWVVENVDGDSYYLDFDKIRRHNDYVYVWVLADYAKIDEYGDISSKSYHLVDCEKSRFKWLSDSYYTQRMAKGEPSEQSNEPDIEWTYPDKDSVDEVLLEEVCKN